MSSIVFDPKKRRELDLIAKDLISVDSSRETRIAVAGIYQAAHEFGIIDEPDPTDEHKDAIAEFCLQESGDGLFFLAQQICGFTYIPEVPHRTEVCPFLVEPRRRKMLYVPRGGLKTTIGGISRNVQKILRDPAYMSIGYGMVTKELADSVGAHITGILEGSAVSHFYGNQKGSPWSGGEFNVAARGKNMHRTFKTSSPESSLISKHPVHMTIDDLYDEKHRNAAWLQTVEEFLKHLWPIVDHPDGTMDIIMTRWSRWDCWNFFEEKDTNKSLYLQFLRLLRQDGRYDELGNWHPWWPEKFTEDFAKEQLDMLGRYNYHLQYKNEALIEGGQIFDENDFEIYTTLPKVGSWVMGCDPANSKKKDSAYSAFVLSLIDTEARNNLVDFEMGKFSSAYERALHVVKLMKRHPSTFGGIQINYEDYGAQIGDLDEIKKQLRIAHEEMRTEAAKSGAVLPDLNVKYLPINQENNPGSKPERISRMHGPSKSKTFRLPEAGTVVHHVDDDREIDMTHFAKQIVRMYDDLRHGSGEWDFADAWQITTVGVRPPVVQTDKPRKDPYETFGHRTTKGDPYGRKFQVTR